MVVGAPAFQSTASCFISPVWGERRASIEPTKPVGADAAWQSRHAVGCVVRDACSRPGKNVAEAAPAWHALHDVDCGTPALLWTIGIGSASRTTVTFAIVVAAYAGSSATTTTSRVGSRTPSGSPIPPAHPPPGSLPEELKYLAEGLAVW